MALSGYHEFQPADSLSDLVKAFWLYKPDFKGPKWDILIPEGVIDIIFNFGAPYFRQSFLQGSEHGQWVAGDVFIGQRTDLFKIRWPHNTQLFAIRLNAAKAYRLYPEPMNKMSNRAVSLNSIGLGSLSEAIKVTGINDVYGTIKQCQQLLPALSKQHEKAETILTRAIALIDEMRGEIDVATLCAKLNIEKRTLERNFQRFIGLSPKYYIRVKRLHYFLCLHQSTQSKITDSAFDAQFYDQSHFIREFKAFTGSTPQAFFNSPPKIYQPLLTSLQSEFEKICAGENN